MVLALTKGPFSKSHLQQSASLWCLPFLFVHLFSVSQVLSPIFVSGLLGGWATFLSWAALSLSDSSACCSPALGRAFCCHGDEWSPAGGPDIRALWAAAQPVSFLWEGTTGSGAQPLTPGDHSEGTPAELWCLACPFARPPAVSVAILCPPPPSERPLSVEMLLSSGNLGFRRSPGKLWLPVTGLQHGWHFLFD